MVSCVVEPIHLSGPFILAAITTALIYSFLCSAIFNGEILKQPNAGTKSEHCDRVQTWVLILIFTLCEINAYVEMRRNIRKVVILSMRSLREMPPRDCTFHICISTLRRSDKVQSGELECSLLQQTAWISAGRYSGRRVSYTFHHFYWKRK